MSDTPKTSRPPKIENHGGEGKVKRQHRATYATDKRKGGYLVRVEGPNAALFLGRVVPVTLKSGDEQSEKLTKLVWSGPDADTGVPVGLYQFEAKPREVVEYEF